MSKENVIAVASDHGGFELKCLVQDMLKSAGYEVLDLGTNSTESVDYPEFGDAMAGAITGGMAKMGILMCGTGIGISIAANRHPEVRAAVCHDVTTARLCREHNDANVLALGARIVGAEVALDCVRTFLSTEFEGGRHSRRVEKLGAGA